MNLRPVKVTAVLDGPLGADPPMLESLCEAAMVGLMNTIRATSNGHRHAAPFVGPGEPVPPEALGTIPIPIAREVVEVDGLPRPIFRASSPVMSRTLHDSHANYTSQYPLGKTDLLTDRERTKIVASGGRFKSFRLPLRTRTLDRVVWFAALRTGGSRGAPACELRKLLSKRVRAIGKKTSFGYGRVAEWIVEPCDEDLSWLSPSPAGPVLMRPLPACMELPAGLIGFRRDFGGVHGPYWQSDYYCERVVPC